MMKRKLLLISVLISFFSFIPIARSVVLEYYIIIEENGNSIVIITMYGKGLVTIPLQEDVNDVRVKGGLYMIENGSVDVSIGSTEKAVLLYKTGLLTTRKGNLWNFNMSLTGLEKGEITVVMPNSTKIKNTEPSAFIESGEFTKLMWMGNPQSVFIEYSFEDVPLGGFLTSEESRVGVRSFNLTPVLVSGGMGVLAMIIIFVKKRWKVLRMKNKENIMRTLATNEKKIVSILLESNGGMKRSRLEKKSGIAKSSLASALKNLEKKNIIEVDKTYRSHYVKFTKWFDEL